MSEVKSLLEAAADKRFFNEERSFIEGGEYVIKKITEALTPQDVSSYKELIDNVFNVIEELQREGSK